MTDNNSFLRSFFHWLVNHPWPVVVLAMLLLLGGISQIPTLSKDTRADAFLADDNPALLYREKVKEQFGLSDPMVIAVTAPASIFTVDGLNAIASISERISDIEHIDPDGITSLATENNIAGSEEGMDVKPFWEGRIDEQSQAVEVRDAVRHFPLYQGSLVSLDESAALVVAELLDDVYAEQVYDDLLSAMQALDLPEGIDVHVAGEGAIAGYLGQYIDNDANRLNPIAGLVITMIILLAFRRVVPAITGNIVVAASVLITLGVMAAMEVPFYVITNALPVILIGIAVADSVHIYSGYFERSARQPEADVKDIVVGTMMDLWRPITLTTLTTIAGFIGLSAAAYMPPFKAFGAYAALGVLVAWLYSLVLLPALMALFKTPVNSKIYSRAVNTGTTEAEVDISGDRASRIMAKLGGVSGKHPKVILLLGLAIILSGVTAATQLRVDDDRINTFHSEELLYKADKVINQRFNGSYYLDVVVETSEVEGLFDPLLLERIDAMQTYAKSLAHVREATSIVDYLKQINKSLNGGGEEQYRLPNDSDLIAQYFLTYSASGSPTDFEEEVDYDYQVANVRLSMDSGSYSDAKSVVEAMDNYLSEQLNDSQISANLSGRVNLNYHWIKDLGHSHFVGMGVAFALVWLVSSLLFRSAVAGVYTLLPVLTSVLLVYAVMALLNIELGIGTSMFAAVAIGLGVDFSIHTLDRLRSLYRELNSMPEALKVFYPETGRALLFNLLALALGFGVLVSSKVVPLNDFGLIVALAVTSSFVFSLFFMPALLLVFTPRFLNATHIAQSTPTSAKLASVAALATALYLAAPVEDAMAQELPEGRWLAEQVNSVDEGEYRTSKLSMLLTDRRGKLRERNTVVYRRYYGEEKRTAIFYTAPRNIKNTGFLTYDYPQADRDDDQWLYLPAMRKSRRISASDRGDYFLGTDFSYEDIKKEGKFELSDFDFKSLGIVTIEGRETIQLESIPINKSIAKELGYGKVHAWIDTDNWIVIKAEYWDIKLNPLKSLVIRDIRKVDGIWTRHELEATNHKTGHTSLFRFSEVDYKAAVPDSRFSRQALARGVPK